LTPDIRKLWCTPARSRMVGNSELIAQLMVNGLTGQAADSQKEGARGIEPGAKSRPGTASRVWVRGTPRVQSVPSFTFPIRTDAHAWPDLRVAHHNHRRLIPTIPATTSRAMSKGESERTAAAAKS